MTNNADIVMRRVRAIHFLRPIVSGSALALLVAFVALYEIGREVWVAKVFENMPGDILSALQFFLMAFSNTEFTVQALTLVTGMAVLCVAKDIGRTVVRFA